MTERLICLACLVIGYGFGLLQVAHIYSKAKNINIREKGSGNAGTTNMFRVMGIKAGIITLIGDCAKLVVAVILTKLIFLSGLGFQIDPTALALYTGFGCVLGHDFPFYFHFKGGKGMASTAALVCCLGNWQMILIGVAVFFGIVIATKYVSLGSMITVCTEFVLFILFTQIGWFPLQNAWMPDCYILFFLLAALLVFQHRKNINRLMNHKETRFYFRTSSQIKEEEAAHRENQTTAKIEHVQQKAEKKMDRLKYKAEKKIAHAQNKAELVQTKLEQVQNKADYKYRKVQLKAELKEEKTKNWAGKIADHAPKSFRLQDENHQQNLLEDKEPIELPEGEGQTAPEEQKEE